MSEFVEKAIDILTLPLIFKESFGSFGAQVFLCNTKEEIYSHISEKPFILKNLSSTARVTTKELK